MPAVACALPSSSRREQARRVKAQVDALDVRLENAVEDYDAARERYVRLDARTRTATKRLGRIRARMDTLQGHLNTRVGKMYRTGPLGFVEVLFGAKSFEDFATTWDVLTDMSDTDAGAVRRLETARAEASAAKSDVVRATSKARAELSYMARRKKAIRSSLAQRTRLLHGLEAEVAALERAEEARAAARRHASSTISSRGESGGWDWGSPVREPRAGIVDVAKRYLGRPYSWGASGPGSFDCSGFTMFVYAQVGVSLPHSSRAQIGCGERVGRDDLAPGDLVFFGGSRIHHVGIYVGNGQYIHAPHSGDVVRISPMDRGDYAGAARP